MTNIKIEITENDVLFVNHVLKMYARTTPGLDNQDQRDILDIANKFKI